MEFKIHIRTVDMPEGVWHIINMMAPSEQDIIAFMNLKEQKLENWKIIPNP